MLLDKIFIMMEDINTTPAIFLSPSTLGFSLQEFSSRKIHLHLTLFFSELEFGILTKFQKKQHLFNNVMFLLLLPSSLLKLYLYFDKSLIYRIFFKIYFYLPWFSKLSWIHLLNSIILKVLQADLVPVPRTCCWRNRWIWLLMSQTAQ